MPAKRTSNIDERDLEILKSELRLEIEHKLDEREAKIKQSILTPTSPSLPKEFWWAVAVIIPLLGAFFWFNIHATSDLSDKFGDMRVKFNDIQHQIKRTEYITEFIYNRFKPIYGFKSIKSITSNLNPTNSSWTNR